MTDQQWTSLMIQFTLLENRLDKIQEDIDKLKPLTKIYDPLPTPKVNNPPELTEETKKKIDELFRRQEPYVNPIIDYAIVLGTNKDGKCLYKSVKPNTPMGLSCPCPKHSAYCSMTTLTEEDWSQEFK